eukprot:6715482-Karenia_brevis.AAC.1
MHLPRWSTGWLDIPHGSVWQDVHTCLVNRPLDSVSLVKVAGHSTMADVRAGRCTLADKLGNDYADLLARRGA